MSDILAQQAVLSVGWGKAGNDLHGAQNWLAMGEQPDERWGVIAFDNDPTRLNIDAIGDERVRRTLYAAQEAGRLVTIESLDQLAEGNLLDRLRVVDIVTASGTHVAAAQQTLDVLCGIGADRETTDALTWLWEKPVYSGPEEGQALEAMLQSGAIDSDRIFVNENYNVSNGVAFARQLIGTTPISQVDVTFYKNRVPDVIDPRKHRSVDPVLKAYGIEAPHMVAVAYNIAGVAPGSAVSVIDSVQLEGVHGIPESIGSYTSLVTDRGTLIRIAQGLGPYEIDGLGNITPNENPGVVRYCNISLQDGRRIKVEFDPVKGIDRLTSRVTESIPGREDRVAIVPDNMLRKVIQDVAGFALKGEVPATKEALSMKTNIGIVRSVAEFARIARTADHTY